MKVGIIGSGGREHAICHALHASKKIKKIYCFPGNAGTSSIAENSSLNLENFNGLKDFIISNKIDLIISQFYISTYSSWNPQKQNHKQAK